MSVFTDRVTTSKTSHYFVVLLVFAITGSLAAILSRLLLNSLFGMDGSLWSGPWTYRLAYLALIPPSYSVMLLGIGTLFGKHAYFKKRVLRIWGRPLRLLGIDTTSRR